MQKHVCFVLSSKPHLWLQHLLKIFKPLNIFTHKPAKNTSWTISINQTLWKITYMPKFPRPLISVILNIPAIVFPSLLFCCYLIFFSVKHRLSNLLSSYAVFWGNLQELAIHQWLVPGIVRGRGQSFSLTVAKLVIPAGLCSPKQTYRLQPPTHTQILLWTRTAPPLPGQSCTSNHWLMVAACGLFSDKWGQFETQTFAHACSDACVFMEEDQMMEIMQNLAQQFFTNI